MGLRGTGAGESGTEDERGHGGVCISTSRSKPVWAPGTVTKARAAKQMDRICCGRDQKPLQPREQTLPLCVSSYAPSWSDRHQLRRR